MNTLREKCITGPDNDKSYFTAASIELIASRIDACKLL